MVLHTWPDGAVLERDSRGDDPVYYYRLGSVWSRVVGIVVQPLYQEDTVPQVTVAVFEAHRDRFAQLPPSAQEQLLVRVIAALLPRHPHWQRVTLSGFAPGLAAAARAVAPDIVR